MIGSVIGVGLANQFMAAAGTATSGVDWHQAANIGKSLLISPLVGFVRRRALLLIMQHGHQNKALYEAPVGEAPPPFWIRCLLLLTCTGVSFAHGSNDGQKGMGLIMLILIGTVPTAYALNHAVPAKESQDFIAVSAVSAETLGRYAAPNAAVAGDGRAEVTDYVRSRQLEATTVPALRKLVSAVGHDMAIYKELQQRPGRADAQLPQRHVPHQRGAAH